MDIKVIGTGCDKCTALYKNTIEALKKCGIEAKVEKIEDLMDIVRLGVMSAPSLMIDGKLVISGRISTAEEIAKILVKAI
ncbi:MAG: thioredoxin family protein [Clostridiaceae bacterium]|nr:thioredoxin family protein [Clostridiaceae bacterium]